LAGLEEALRRAVRGEVYFDVASRGMHATDASHYQMMPPVWWCRATRPIVWPQSNRRAFWGAITPRGGGTSLSGQTFGSGMVIDTSKYMDQVLEVNADQCWARVQPGVVRDRLNAHLAPLGLHLAPDPATGNRATIGGMIGNNASGTRSLVYGKTIDHLLACKVVLSDGTVMDLQPSGRFGVAAALRCWWP
jgi:FAD/FMN-containing dehydrogenase